MTDGAFDPAGRRPVAFGEGRIKFLRDLRQHGAIAMKKRDRFLYVARAGKD